MINFTLNENDGEITMTIEGHANSAPKGEDLVCASVSILAYSLASAISDDYREGKLHREPHIRLNEGNAVVTCKPMKYWHDHVRSEYKVAENGMKMLAEKYPQFVGITA